VRGLVDEFVSDWLISGKSRQTVNHYSKHLTDLFEVYENPTIESTLRWLAEIRSTAVRRKAAQAIRAFGKWTATAEVPGFDWWKRVPIAKEQQRPQTTVTEEDYLRASRKARNDRERALIEVLWSCGLRRAEVSRMNVEDINFAGSFLVIPVTKSGSPRVVPLSPPARRALRRLLNGRTSGSVFRMSSNAIRLCLKRLDVPSAHAWRRGWAVKSLRLGVSEASVRSAAGWTSGAMVVRYTKKLSQELAIEEFQRAWSSTRSG
jgi:integrase